MMITVDLTKAKQIAHDKRRQKREELMEPHDKNIALNIPGDDLYNVEAQRQLIRDQFAQIQIDINAATDTDTIKRVLVDNGVV